MITRFKYISLLFIALSFKTQSDSLELLKIVNEEVEYFTTDILGNIYVVDDENAIIKYNRDGKLRAVQNDKIEGIPSLIDVSDPFEAYCYYPYLNKMIFLDSELSFRGEVTFDELGQVNVAARSHDRGLWAFDSEDLRMKNMDKRGELQLQTGNILEYCQNAINPHFILDNQNAVYLVDSLNSIMEFDVFGQYVKNLNLYTRNEIQIRKEKLFYYNFPELKMLNLVNFQEKNVHLPELDGLEYARMEDERLYLLKDKKLFLYSIK